MKDSLASQSSVEAFAHEPLDLSKPSIRVLRILPGRWDDPIQCTLKHAARVEDTYVALSYTWGVDLWNIHDSKHPISVNSEPFQVRANLWDFLRRARQLKIKDWLWIDALCIDQMNDRERNHQVQQMADVYRQAKHVLVYPGDSRWPLPLAAKLVWYSPGQEALATSGLRHAHLPLLYNSVLFSMCGRNLVDMATSHYWNRSWIIQELLLAKKLYLVSNLGLVRWESFRLLYSVNGLCAGDRALWARSHMVWEFCRRDDTVSLKGIGRHGRLVDLFEKFHGKSRLHDGRNPQCSGVRDQVYSFLGLAEDAAGFTVDYQRSPVTLFLDTLEHFGQNTHNPAELHNFIDHLMQSLGVSVRCYSLDCAKELIGLANENSFLPRQRRARVLLVVHDASNEAAGSHRFTDTCTCFAMNLLENNWHNGPPGFTRVDANKTYLFWSGGGDRDSTIVTPAGWRYFG